MQFLVYGIPISINSCSESVLQDLQHDFGYFWTPMQVLDTDKAFSITHEPCASLVDLGAPFVKLKNSSLYWSKNGERRVSFFNKAWVLYNFKSRYARIYSDDEVSATEAMHLVFLSYVGERLDELGLHRLHGMGFVYNGRGSVLLAPSGGGKSTLALKLLLDPHFGFLSDDTPLVSRDRVMYAFPQRIAVRENPNVAEEYVRIFHRNNHGTKFVIGSGFFKNRVVESVRVSELLAFTPRNSLLVMPGIRKCALAWYLTKWLFFGYETPQIWQLYLRFSPESIWRKFKIALSRAMTLFELLKLTPLHFVDRSRDPKTTQLSLLSLFQAEA